MPILQNETEFYAALFAQIEEMVIMTTPDDERVIYWNHAAERLYGIPAAQIVGRPLAEFFQTGWFTKEDYEEAQTALRRDGFWRGYIWVRQYGGGEWKLNASLKMVHNATGEIIGCLSITHETIDNRPILEEIEETTRQLRVLTDRAPVFLWDADTDGDPSYFNKVWLEFTGHTLEAQVAGGWEDTIHPEDFAKMVAHWQEVRGTDNTFQMLYRVRRHDGVYRWLLGTTIPRFAPDGTLSGYVGAAVDVTERKQKDEQAQARQRDEWEMRQWESLGSIAGGIAHDFNNILTAILGYADLAQSALAPDSQPYTDLARLQSAAQHAATLTRQMLDYSGQNVTRIQSVDIADLVQEITDGMQLPMNISLVTKCDAALPHIKADPNRLKHLLSALLSNAVEALDGAAGFITVSAQVITADSELLTRLGQSGLGETSYLHLTVTDTGHGIEEATLSRVFEPFFSTKFTGRGLGLAAAQGIARSHKGSLSAESHLGIGSTFHLLLPVAE